MTLTNTCPHCGQEGHLVSDYYEAVNQSIEVDEEGNWDYTGTLDTYDDGSTSDECIRCSFCGEEVETFGSYTFIPEGEKWMQPIDAFKILFDYYEIGERDWDPSVAQFSSGADVCAALAQFFKFSNDDYRRLSREVRRERILRRRRERQRATIREAA